MVANAAVFGVDNRRSLTGGTVIDDFARSTAVAVISSYVTSSRPGTLDLQTDPSPQMCAGEPFANERFLNYACTGFLIAPDLLVTAGHCVYAVNTPNQELKNETGLSCKTFAWLFDYADSKTSLAQTAGLNANRLFGCKQIIYATQTEKAPFLDYALIQLDRPAFGRSSFKIASNLPQIGSSVSMIGYPFGMPVQFSDHARVTLDQPARDSFLTNLDAFPGNSGSPVLNAKFEVVGILIGGTPTEDFYTDKKSGCQHVNRCDDGGKSCVVPDTNTAVLPGYQGVGSEVQRIAPIRKLLEK